jgi:hypothetical protein
MIHVLEYKVGGIFSLTTLEVFLLNEFGIAKITRPD